MRTKLFALLLTLPLLSLSFLALAQTTPVGTWTTIDDTTKQPKSVVDIYEAHDGTLAGRVAEILSSNRGAAPLCDKCPGDRRNKPVKGMVILWGIKKVGDTWEGGKILDPASGKIYSVKVRPKSGGTKLDVRGFLGFSLLGRSQTWVRKS